MASDRAGEEADRAHLRRTLALAARGRGTTSPNPMVGAVLVAGGVVVGEGFHRRTGGPHAEVIALRRADLASRGATLYVNLEPCSHHGRTPPCVEAIIGSGVRRLEACMTDPDRRVQGRGLAALRRAGVTVSCGLLGRQARSLNEAYIKYTRTGRPFVLLKAGMSLDGKIATAAGFSRWITSPASRKAAHDLRWDFDSILVGVGTVLADDPELVARRGRREKPDWLRVVLDSRLRIPASSRLVRSARRWPTRVYTLHSAPAARERRLRRAGVEVVRVASRGGRVSTRRMLEDLGRSQVTSVLAEGGGEVHGSLLSGGEVDRVILFVAPTLLGGVDAIPVVGGRGVRLPSGAPRLSGMTVRRLGPDLVVEGVPVPGPL